MADIDPDVRWMSYAEAAQTLRVTPESLHRRMRRNGWARREGNDGKPRVAVPIADDLAAAPRPSACIRPARKSCRSRRTRSPSGFR